MTEIIRGPPVATVESDATAFPNAVITYTSGNYILAYGNSARILATATGYPLHDDRYIVIHRDWWQSNMSILKTVTRLNFLSIQVTQ